MNNKYDVKTSLNHNEFLQKVNKQTGEVKQVSGTKKPSNGMQKFNLMKTYHRRNSTAWRYLEEILSAAEYRVADKLALMAKAFTSSLEPLEPNSTATEIAKILDVNRNTISKIMDKLFKKGVYARFEVCDENERHTRYLVFNPYLAFNGNVIKDDIPTLFDKTMIARVAKTDLYISSNN